MLLSILKGVLYTEWKAAPSNSLLDNYLIHFSSGFSSTFRFTKKGFLTFCQFFRPWLYSHFISYFLCSLQQPLLWQDKAVHKKSFHGHFTSISIFEREIELKQHDSLIHFSSLSVAGLTGLGYRQTHCHLQFECPTGHKFRMKGVKKIPTQLKSKTYLMCMTYEDTYQLFFEAWCLWDSFCTEEKRGCGLLRSVKACLAVLAWMSNYLWAFTYVSPSTACLLMTILMFICYNSLEDGDFLLLHQF